MMVSKLGLLAANIREGVDVTTTFSSVSILCHGTKTKESHEESGQEKVILSTVADVPLEYKTRFLRVSVPLENETSSRDAL
jgi:hypothetical protein